MSSYSNAIANDEIVRLLNDQRAATADYEAADGKPDPKGLDTYGVKLTGWHGGETHTFYITGDQLFKIRDILAGN